MSKKHKIKVQLGTKFKRESVLIDLQGKVLAEGENKMQLVKKIYGK